LGLHPLWSRDVRGQCLHLVDSNVSVTPRWEAVSAEGKFGCYSRLMVARVSPIRLSRRPNSFNGEDWVFEIFCGGPHKICLI
jgi:hypothetical protein